MSKNMNFKKLDLLLSFLCPHPHFAFPNSPSSSSSLNFCDHWHLLSGHSASKTRESIHKKDRGLVFLEHLLTFHLDRHRLPYLVAFYLILLHLESHPIMIPVLVDCFSIVHLIPRLLVEYIVMQFLDLLALSFVVRAQPIHGHNWARLVQTTLTLFLLNYYRYH